MRAHILQHVPFEGVGGMAGWLSARRAHISGTRFFEDPILPVAGSLENLDLVIAMGGPMSVNDEDEFPWLADEKDFIRRAIENDVAVIGVCLGAQLIASALGAKVYRNTQKEIGWFEIEGTPRESSEITPAGGVKDLFNLPPSCTVFHWHGETFDLPVGAVHLARSAACKNQAFQLKHNVIGLQCHLEVTPEIVAAMLDHCGEELRIGGQYIQDADAIGKAPPQLYAQSNALLDQILSYITAR